MSQKTLKRYKIKVKSYECFFEAPCKCCYRDNVSEEEESHGTSADQSSEAGYEEETRLSPDEPVSPARRKIEKV